ncbi:GTP 3',8-cyclase MoaA [Ornithinimicrobium sediminis]|uniref:GTP 3',8-cyclase MoaA n=1 Tax=Ornithinimicrobium sediminis TaxID=2904603 RepID=UPI001E5102CC|nr:GTP 3',8-cyclase MoaA [Ornithinimicrobium sediminis]MCE0487138.1 GTP 3',8-cyclase MoaA [Ornithinimicrobium sediminis]
MDPLVDRFGRVHRDLRISLTDRCSLRCTYCMPEQGVPWLAKPTLLSTDELLRLTEVAVSLGIVEVRLTGGEPLLRRDLVEVVAGISSMQGVDGPVEVSMTTNALGLDMMAVPLVEAGMARVNISLDTLDRDTFVRMARRDRLDDTLEGIRAAADAGLAPVKLNTVLLRDVNDVEAPQLLAFALEHGYELRFIEQMPLDAGHTWHRESMVTGQEVLDRLRTAYHLEPVPQRGSAPAELFLVDGGPATVGVIASVSSPFCGTCDRVRLTADGQLRNCLFAAAETDLRTPLRDGAGDDELAALFRASIGAKLPGHGINEPGFLQPPRNMSAIGG